MTRTSAKLLLPLIQQWAEGAELQMLDGAGVWQEFATWNFDADPSMYRIKPKEKTLGEVAFDAYADGLVVRQWEDCEFRQSWERAAAAVVKAYHDRRMPHLIKAMTDGARMPTMPPPFGKEEPNHKDR